MDMSSPLMYGTPSSRVEGTPRSGVRGTPARQRPDLGSVRKAPQVDLHSEPVSLLPVATRSSDPRFKRRKLKNESGVCCVLTAKRRWRCCQRVQCGTATGDLGDRRQCRDLQGEVSGSASDSASWYLMIRSGIKQNRIRFSCRDSCRGSSIRPPAKTRTPAWT